MNVQMEYTSSVFYFSRDCRGDRLFHKFPVYVQILERDIFCSANPVFTFLDVIEAAVFHAYIINVLVR